MPCTLYLIPCCFSLYLLPYFSYLTPYTLYLAAFPMVFQVFFHFRWPYAICCRPPASAARLRFYGTWWGSRSSRAREMVGRATFDCKTLWFCHIFAPKTSWSLLGALGPPGCLLHIRGIECMHFYVQHGNPAYRIHAFLCAMLRPGI